MAERMTERDLERALVGLGTALAYPPAPPMAPAVTARLLTERQVRRRPPFPGLALWPRRRVLVLAVALVLLLAGTAVAARLAIGAIEIRVVQSPSAPTQPPAIETGAALGQRVTLAQARAAVGFPIALPSELGPPSEVRLTRAAMGSRLVFLVWSPDDAHPRIPGTPWGTILLELPGANGPIGFKEVMPDSPVEPVFVGSHGGFWFSGPHDLVLTTASGERRFTVRGNVVLWQRGDTTLRLETALPKEAALALAQTTR